MYDSSFNLLYLYHVECFISYIYIRINSNNVITVKVLIGRFYHIFTPLLLYNIQCFDFTGIKLKILYLEVALEIQRLFLYGF